MDGIEHRLCNWNYNNGNRNRVGEKEYYINFLKEHETFIQRVLFVLIYTQPQQHTTCIALSNLHSHTSLCNEEFQFKPSQHTHLLI